MLWLILKLWYGKRLVWRAIYHNRTCSIRTDLATARSWIRKGGSIVLDAGRYIPSFWEDWDE